MKKESSRVGFVIADALWLAGFVGIWTLLIAYWNTWWVLVLVPMFTLMLAGIGELLHQTAHYNLFGRVRLWNDVIGWIAAAMVGIDLKTYRPFHLKHHRAVNTGDDPERAIYSFPEYAEKAEGWKTLSNWNKAKMVFGIASRFSHALVSVLGANAPLVRIMRVTIPSFIVLTGFFEGLFFLIPAKMIVAWYMPLFLVSFVDLLLTQSRHYGTELKAEARRVPLPEQYEISWNLKLPLIIELMILRRNLHAEHHEYPATHWSIARDKQAGRTLPLAAYLQAWWANGPRVM